MKLLIVLLLVAIGLVGLATAGFPKPHPLSHKQLPPIHPNHHYQNHQPHARFYADSPPKKIIASPKPRALYHHHGAAAPPPPPNYRTVNPMFVPYRGPRSEHIHNQHQQQQKQQQHQHQQPTPQLLASPSNTPVLVLKKDHSRPVLSSALQASVNKRSEQQQQQHQHQIPTIKIDRSQQHHHHHQSESEEAAAPPPPPPNTTTTNKPQQQPDNNKQLQDLSLESDQMIPTLSQELEELEKAVAGLSSSSSSPKQQEQEQEQQQSAQQSPQSTASAERRMFFESVATNSNLAQQVSGPRQPTGPSSHSSKSNKKPTAHHHHSSQRSHHHHNPQFHATRRDDAPPPAASSSPHHHDDDEEENNKTNERITRSNSNNPSSSNSPHPYQQGLPFQYPPPQGNFIASGPTRVPVKYQQGVVGFKPQQPQQPFIGGGGHGFGGHPSQGGGGRKQRPYKQRIQQAQRQSNRQQQQSEELLDQRQPTLSEEELEDEEQEEATPDRLTELLATSKFTCDGKKDGYYADDGLACEVFHYCNAGTKHSWLCPNGFAFHQIHLICVPPSSDNICKQSSNYHFVNEYLYKPINEKEAQTYNESLKYADRYFPDGYNQGAGDVLLPYHQQQQQQHQQTSSEEEEEEQHRQHQLRLRQQQQQHQQGLQRPSLRPQQHPTPHFPNSPYNGGHALRAGPASHQSSPYNPYAHIPSSPTPARPLSGGFVPSQQISPRIPSQSPHHHHQQQQNHHNPHHHHPSSIISSPRPVLFGSQSQVHPQTIVPQKPISKNQKSSHKSSSSSSPQQQQQPQPSVFFSPEDINIPLNQRRPIPNPHAPHLPQIFRPSANQQPGAKKRSSSSSHSNPHHHHHHGHSQSSHNNKKKYHDYEEY